MKTQNRPGAVAHTSNPEFWEAEVERLHKLRSSRTILDNIGRPHLYKILKKKIIWTWWCMPVVPTTQAVKVGISLELKRLRLQWAKMENPTPKANILNGEWLGALYASLKTGQEFLLSPLFTIVLEIWARKLY